MANVNIAPTINHGEQDINKMVKQLLNAYIVLTEELTHILNHLDTRNMTEIDGDILVSGTVTAGKILVDKLSAISADMGKITAGQIYGAYIATREAGYPFVELSNTNNMLGAYKSEGNSVQIYSPVDKLSPVIKFEAGGKRSYIFYDPTDNTFSVTSNDANVRIDSGGRLDLFGSSGSYVQNWNFFKNNTSGRSLQQDLDAKATYGNQTGSAGSANGGIPPGTVLRTADGGTVTWVGISDHTHTQK